MIHTSGLLRVTDVIKDLRCGVVTIVTLLVDWRNDYSACSTLTCFRGFLHYDMTRSVMESEMGKKALTDMLEVEGGPGKCISLK